MKEQNHSTAIAGTIVAIIVLYIIIASGSSDYGVPSNKTSNDSTPALKTTAPEQTALEVPVATKKIASAEEIRTCAEDGQKFSKNYEQTHTISIDPTIGNAIWMLHSYHFNTRLNTCLVTVSYSQEATKITSMYDLASPNFAIVWNTHNLVFDAYSNRPVLQNALRRTTVNKTETDTLLTDGIYTDIPNLGGETFAIQYKILMNE